MAQDDALTFAREHHIMLADDVAAPDGGKADITFVARAGDAITPRVADLIEFHTTALGGRLAQHERSS